MTWSRCRRRKRGPISIPCEGGVSAGPQEKVPQRSENRFVPGKSVKATHPLIQQVSIEILLHVKCEAQNWGLRGRQNAVCLRLA